MKDADVESRTDEILSRARRRLSPSALDTEHVLVSIFARLDAPCPTDFFSPDAPSTGFLARFPAWVRRAVPLIGVAALSGGLSYQAGLHAGGERASTKVPREMSAKADPPQHRHSAETTPERSPPLPTEKPERRAFQESTDETQRARSSGSGGNAARSGDDGLEEELRTLRRVDRAQRDGNARLALSLLDDLDREVPAGKLGEERAAARTLARCTLGYGAQSVLHREFVQRHPGSVYAARVAEACGVADAADAATAAH
jgi:hypothetical protein